MKIISHRGYWKYAAEKNSLLAFEHSFALSFGTETDVRDHGNELVISHDVPMGGEVTLEKLLCLATSNQTDRPLTLALNIKADGLAGRLSLALARYPELDCFVFDMSVPDMLGYFDMGIPVFTRMSEVERAAAWLERSAGVWLDGFDSEWYGVDHIRALMREGKRVCVVSPELHGRPHLPFWNDLKPLVAEPSLMLCTDYPEQAADHFSLNKQVVL